MARLAATQPQPSLWSLRALNAHARAQRDDTTLLATTLELVERTQRPLERATLLLRASEAAARLQDLAAARQHLEQAANEDPGDVVTWGVLADLRQRAGDARRAAEACEALARTSVVRAHQLLAWHDASRLWLDDAKDVERGMSALEACSEIDVTYTDVFTRLSALYAERKLDAELARVAPGVDHARAPDASSEGVRVQDIPVGVADPLLLGFVTGVLTIRGKGDATESLEGEGQLEVREPEYRFLRQASESLRPFGLPDLPPRGTEPFRARLIFGGGRVTVRGIDGRVEGMRFEGTIDLGWSRRLSGTILAHLEQRYLARSVVLALPSIFTGQLTVPLEISGQVGAPRYTADLVGTLGRLVTGNSVTGAITGLVDGVLGNLLGGERRDEDPRKPRRGGLGGFLDALS